MHWSVGMEHFEGTIRMNRTVTKRVRVGNFLAEVKVGLIPDDGAWGPYLSADDAIKLDRVRQALQRSDIAAVKREAQVFELTPLA